MNYPGILPRAVCGNPDTQTLPEYSCPICGAQLMGSDRIAEDKDGNAVGCDYCIRYYEIWEKETNDYFRN